jgi:hypothetical protein
VTVARAEHDLLAVRWFVKDDRLAQVREFDGGYGGCGGGFWRAATGC